MVPSPPQEPTRRLCGYDAAVLVVHPENPKLRMNQFYVAHFQDHLRLPSLSPITVPFDEKLNVAMFVLSSLFDGFYAPFFGCTFGLHSFPLQHIMSYNNRIKYTVTRGPHYEHSQNTHFKTNSMRTPAILITAVQWCIQHSPPASFRGIPEIDVHT